MPQRGTPDRARRLHLNGQVLVLREVHSGRLRTRAELTHEYGMSRGSASELTARLRQAELLDERPVESSGRRGRPTSSLGPHPAGPLVCAVDVGYDSWQAGIFSLGGILVESRRGAHGPGTAATSPDAVFGTVATAVTELATGRPNRIAAVSVSVTGTVRGSRVVQASTLGWRDVDVASYFDDGYQPVLVGNDATLAGLAEARRGAASGARVSLHLLVSVGIGGVLVVDGRPQTGATGAGGEFGHLPFGDARRQCPCGAHGCWDIEVDGRALAHLLGLPAPKDPRRLADQVLARARSGDAAALAALDRIAANLGHGAGALVNALDPEMVTLFGLGADLLAVSGPALRAAYRDALMAFRRSNEPPVLPSSLPAPASLIGAAENGFDRVLTETGLDDWRERRTATG